MAASTKGLFLATKRKRAPQPELGEFEIAPKPQPVRDPLDYDPTPADATAAFLAVEGDRMREIGGPVWEPAVGGGHMADELKRDGFEVIGSDIVDRGYPGTIVRPFYAWTSPPARIKVTNPPYNEVSARDGHGRWLRHCYEQGIPYVAMLLNWDWIAARMNGMDELHDLFPVSRAYVCCWKIDFRGGGSPPQRNGWLVWDFEHTGPTTLHRLFRDPPDKRQKEMF